MPKVHLHKRVRHTPEDMLDLVIDIEDYPTFINFVSKVRILDRKQFSKTKEEFTADLGVQYKFVSERFRSIVKVDREVNTLRIERAGHGGAVRELDNFWKFVELKDGSTLIDFSLNVRMKAAPLDFLIRQKFDKATQHIVDVFERRAAQICEFIGDEDYDYSSEISA